MPAKSLSESVPAWMRLAIIAIILLGLLRYCGRDRATDGRIEVYGHVSHNGDGLAAGQIFFMPAEQTGGPAAAGRIRRGQYRIPAAEGPTPGEYQVRILTGEPGPPGGSRNIRETAQNGDGRGLDHSNVSVEARRDGGEQELEVRMNFLFIRSLTESAAEQDFTLTPDASRRWREHSSARK